jgi:hypothetical protein
VWAWSIGTVARRGAAIAPAIEPTRASPVLTAARQAGVWPPRRGEADLYPSKIACFPGGPFGY